MRLLFHSVINQATQEPRIKQLLPLSRLSQFETLSSYTTTHNTCSTNVEQTKNLTFLQQVPPDSSESVVLYFNNTKTGMRYIKVKTKTFKVKANKSIEILEMVH